MLFVEFAGAIDAVSCTVVDSLCDVRSFKRPVLRLTRLHVGYTVDFIGGSGDVLNTFRVAELLPPNQVRVVDRNGSETVMNATELFSPSMTDRNYIHLRLSPCLVGQHAGRFWLCSCRTGDTIANYTFADATDANDFIDASNSRPDNRRKYVLVTE